MIFSQLPDEKLVELSLSGADAFKEIVHRYSRRVYDIAFRMVKNRESAEDISQEVFLRVYRCLKQYKPKYKFSNWVLKTATNLTINYMKQSRINVISIEDAKLREICPAKEYQTWNPEALKESVNKILDYLLPQHKMAFVLVYQEGYSYKDASEMMDLPLGSFKTYIHKARNAVIDKITAQE